jgi:nicotinamide-nucleotide amidase
VTRTADDTDFAPLVARLADRLAGTGLQLVTAESCTGGWLAKACTDRPGSSGWFRGGVVAYSNDLKVLALGVQPATLAREGAVSEATAREMAAGALERLGGDLSVAITGVAGPDGGTPARPVGTVCLAWAQREGNRRTVRAVQRVFPGGRDAVRRAAVEQALQGLLES